MKCKNCGKTITADHECGYCKAVCMDEGRGDNESQYLAPGETPPEWITDTPEEFPRAILGRINLVKEKTKP